VADPALRVEQSEPKEQRFQERPTSGEDSEHRKVVGSDKEGAMVESSVPMPEKSSLYARLGGVYRIATVVDDFVDRVMNEPRLDANPLVNEAHHRVPPAWFKHLVTEMVCGAADGGGTQGARWTSQIAT
jgi:hypothetical protein